MSDVNEEVNQQLIQLQGLVLQYASLVLVNLPEHAQHVNPREGQELRSQALAQIVMVGARIRDMRNKALSIPFICPPSNRDN